MAACGINEHKEGCRKQRLLDRAAAAKRQQLEATQESPYALQTSKNLEASDGRTSLIAMHGSHSPTAIDRLRREEVRTQQLVTYSAKLPNRLSSVNYAQQW